MSLKILLLSPFPPRRDGLHGGCQAIGRTIKELCHRHSVRLLYLRGAGEDSAEGELMQRCDAVEEIERPGARMGITKLIRAASAFQAGVPLWVGLWRVDAFRQKLRDTVASWQPDVVQFEFAVMAQYRDAVGSVPSVLVVHEPAAAAAWERCLDAQNWREALQREARAWERFERQAVPRFDAAVCFTERDRREIAKLAPGTRCLVIPPCGPVLTNDPIDTTSTVDNTVLFVGNFMHPPNVNAAVWLGQEIFPRLRLRNPTARLVLVGDRVPERVRRLASDEVEVTGRVADVRPYLAKAAVVVIPLRRGSGIRMKTMEALGAGKAVVATSAAVDGLGVTAGHEFLQAETAEEFACSISKLLADCHRRDELRLAAREWAEKYSRPGRLGANYETLYTELIAARNA